MTLRFNQAWCFEQKEKTEVASDLYNAIIKEEPTYTDAYLRLSDMAKRRGEFQQALEYADQARANHVKKAGYTLPTNIICYKASLFSEAGMLNEAL